MRVAKIVTGGQTGADQAAMDAAHDLKIPTGGYIPAGRWTAAGPLPPKYTGMIETYSKATIVRTRKNVEHSSATLVITRITKSRGTERTITRALRANKPLLIVDLDQVDRLAAVDLIRAWLLAIPGDVLNVAGPRLTEDPLIYDDVKELLSRALLPLPEPGSREAMAGADALSNFRHWDVIRWQGIFWYLGFSAPASIVIFGDKLSPTVVSAACFALFVLGLIVCRLVANTMTYHALVEASYPVFFEKIGFSFLANRHRSKSGRWMTATGWGLIACAVLSFLWLSAAGVSLVVPSLLIAQAPDGPAAEASPTVPGRVNTPTATPSHGNK